MGTIQDGRAQDGNQALGLISADTATSTPIIVQGRSLDAIDSLSPFHIVQIQLQHAVFGHDDFHDHRYLCFQVFAQVVAVCSEENGACHLIADGTGSKADASCFLVPLPGFLDLWKLKAKVLVKVAILQCNHHLLRGRGDILQRDVVSFMPIIPPDQVSLEHEGSDRGIDEGIDQAKEGNYAPKAQMQKQNKTQDSNDGSSAFLGFALAQNYPSLPCKTRASRKDVVYSSVVSAKTLFT